MVTDKYQIIVWASDGLLTSTATYTLTVDNITIVPPIVVNLPASIVVSENIDDAIVIFTVNVTDNYPNELNYSVANTIEDESKFIISEQNGDITLSQGSQLDYETTAFYVLNISVINKYGLSDSKILYINITDVDEPPVFNTSDISIRIYEEMTVGDLVPGFYFGATDPDKPTDRVIYTLDNSTGGDYFTLSTSLNALRINTRLDRDVTGVPSVFYLTIYASDVSGLISSITVNITLTDINDNRPVFLKSHYYVSISRATPVGKTLLRVKAIDGDDGINAELNYDIDTSHESSQSFINVTHDGVVTLAKPVTSFTGQIFKVDLKVTDNGIPTLSDKTTIFVSVTSDNLEFSRPFYNFEIRSDAEITEPVGRIQVSGVADNVLYFLTVESTYFNIDKEDGTIWPKTFLPERHKELLYAIARDKLNTTTESKIVMIRIDTYTASECLLDLAVDVKPVDLNPEFISTILDAVAKFIPSPGILPRIVYINKVKVDLMGEVLTNDIIIGNSSVFTIVVLMDNKTEDVNYITEDKLYYDAALLVKYLTGSSNNGGAPLPGIFPVGLVSGIYLHIAPITSWIDTTTGKAVLTTTLLVAVLTATAAAATTIAVRKCRKSSGQQMSTTESTHMSRTETRAHYDTCYAKDHRHVNITSTAVNLQHAPHGIAQESSGDLLTSRKILPEVG